MRLRNAIIPPWMWNKLRRDWVDIPENKFKGIIEYIYDKAIAGEYTISVDYLYFSLSNHVNKAIIDMQKENREEERLEKLRLEKERQREEELREAQESAPPPDGFWERLKDIGHSD